MRHYTDFVQAVPWAVLSNMIVDFLRQPDAHIPNIAFSLVLVGLRHQKHYFREDKGNVISNYFHIL